MCTNIRVELVIMLADLFKPLCLILTGLLLHVSAQSPMIVNGLSDKIVSVGSGSVSMTCRVKAHNLAWFVNDTWYNQNSMIMLQDRGFTFSRLSYDNDFVEGSVTVDISPENKNNNSVIKCTAFTPDWGSVTSNATLLIADVPLPPSPVFMGIDGSTIEVEWEEPFTWEDFPILSYRLEVINETSMMMLDTADLTEDIFSYNLTRNTSDTSCTNISFFVMSVSSVGSSRPGIIHGAFPTAPGMFVESPYSMVSFTSQKIPYLDVSFTLPFLCPYNNATYQLIIEDTQGRLIYTDGPHPMHWSGSGSKITMEINDGELQINMDYLVNITVSTVVGQSNTWFRFNTSIVDNLVALTTDNHTTNSADTSIVDNLVALTTDNHTTNSAETAVIVGVTLGVAGVVALGIVSVVFLIGLMIWINSHQKKNKTVDAMVPNPLYEVGAIYEEIPCQSVHFKSLPRHVNEREEGYVSITSSGKITSLPPPLPPQNNTSMCKDVDEDTYTVMNPAGTPTLVCEGGGVVSPYNNMKET